ncbi:MAG: ATP-grasp domain-containing protein [Chitinophagales bacterium]|nr:ATP-grasp domain-containing protein [Chitinophagales bacterium]MDW8418228.1 ATP-grasp domain-containing protein [Chitinophagales bacterium]
MTKVLITGAGAPGAAGIMHCLQRSRRIEVWGCDANRDASGRHLLKNFFTVPHAADDAFVPALLRKAAAHKIDVILPLVTKELLPLARAKTQFAGKGIRVICSEERALEIANNKSLLYRFLQSRNITVPAFRIVNNLAEFEHAVKELGYPLRRVTFKPAVSNGSRGFRIIDDNIEKSHLLWNEKPNHTFISYAEITQLLREYCPPDLLVSEYLPGEEYSVDCLAQHGKCLLAIPRKRTKILNGISTGGEFVLQREIIRYCHQIIEAIGLHGNIGIQVKRANDGRFKILEINPRVQGTIVTNLAAGANLPLLAVQQELGKPVRPEKLKIRWGLKFVRVWKEIYYE